MLLEEEDKIFKLIEEYLSGEISRERFSDIYSQFLPVLQSKLEDGVYHPLNVIVPTKNNSERAWKEDMRSMYLHEIENLDKLLEEDAPSYAQKLTEEKQKELCEEALNCIPVAALNRTSKEWVEENIIENDEFVFVDEKGGSKLGHSEMLYQAKLVCRSFIMTGLSGDLQKLPYDYALLIETLKKRSHGDTTWLRCLELDGFSSVENTPWYANAEDEIENINWLEYTDPQTTQWGPCYLLFMPSNREWLLVHANDFENFSISLHGSQEFLSSILGELNNA